VAETGSEEGARLLAEVPCRPASAGEAGSARADVDAAAQRMGREMPAVDLRALIQDSM
jgi:hypothetical protein